MNYAQAREHLQAGEKIRLPEWTGYWFKSGDFTHAFTRTGSIVPAWVGSEGETSVINRQDWEVATTGLGFDFAILALKAGKKVCRAGWNGKGMWLKHVKAGHEDVYLAVAADHAGSLKMLNWIGMKTADDCFVPWLASQTDMLANDWEIAS